MGLGLFMNAGIIHAFEDSPWPFVIPMLLALTGLGGYAAATAPAPHLRQHFLRVLVARPCRGSNSADGLGPTPVVISGE
jgi:hypothetical protein